MATVTGVIQGTGQNVDITIPTVRIPELPELVLPIEDDDEMAVYDASENSTRFKKVSDLRTYFGIGGGGSGSPVTPTLQGGDVEIVVDNSNKSGSNRVVSIALQNQKYTLERVGYGQLLSSQFNILPSGGFDLVDDTVRIGDVFFAHTFQPQTSAPGGGVTNTTSLVNGIAIITDDITLNSTHQNKLLHVSSPTKNVTVTLDDIAGVPANLIICIETTISYGFFTKVATQGGQNIYVGESSVTSLLLGSNEFLWLLRGVDGYYVMKISDGVFNVGQPFFDYCERMNSKVAKGQLVAKSAAPRIVDWLAANPNAVIAESLWQSNPLNRAKFVIYDANTLRFPDLQGQAFRGLNNIGGSDTERPGNTVGLLQNDKVGPLTVTIPRGDAYTGNSEQSAMKLGGGQGTHPQSSVTVNAGGTETIMKNAGYLPLIRI